MAEGSGNGEEGGKIVRFPSRTERKKSSIAEGKNLQAQHKRKTKAHGSSAEEPFFNFGMIPPFTKGFIVVMALVQAALYLGFDSGGRLAVIYEFGFIPARFTGAFEGDWSALASPLSHIVIHGSWMHFFFNMAMGLALSLFFERLYGTRATALFFVLCCLGGLLVYFALAPFSTVPVIGASGGISGLFGAALILMLQQVQAQTQGGGRSASHYSSASYYDGRQALRVKMGQALRRRGPWPVVIFWGFLMIVLGMLSGGLAGGDVAWSAHLGGYITGVALLVLLQKGKIRL